MNERSCATKLFVLIRVHSWLQTDGFKSLDDYKVVLCFLKKKPRMDTNIFHGIVFFPFSLVCHVNNSVEKNENVSVRDGMNTQYLQCTTSDFVNGFLIHLSVFICVHLWFLFLKPQMDTDGHGSVLTTNAHEWTRMNELN